MSADPHSSRPVLFSQTCAMDEAKSNQKRVPQIELPPPITPKPTGEARSRLVQYDVTVHSPSAPQKQMTPPPLRPADPATVITDRKSGKPEDEFAAPQIAGDAPPLLEATVDTAPKDAVSQHNTIPPSEVNAVAWIGGAILIGFVAVGIALKSSTTQSPDAPTRTRVESAPFSGSVVSDPPDQVELHSPVSEPAVSRHPNTISQPHTPDTPTIPTTPRSNRLPPRNPPTTTPVPKEESGRTYAWRGRSYYIPPNQMQRFNAIKKAGVTKLAAMDKLTNQINSIGFQMQKADRKAKARLASQRDELAAQHSAASAEYARIVSEMDQMMSSVGNP